MANKLLTPSDIIGEIISELSECFQIRNLNTDEKNKLPSYLMHNKIAVERKYKIVSDGLSIDHFLMMFQKDGFIFSDLLNLNERNTHRMLRANITQQLSVLVRTNKKYYGLFNGIMRVLGEYHKFSYSVENCTPNHFTCENCHFVSHNIFIQKFLQYQQKLNLYYKCTDNIVDFELFYLMFVGDQETIDKHIDKNVVFEGCPACAKKTICSGNVPVGGILEQDCYFSCSRCKTISYLMYDYKGRWAKCKRCSEA
jgi:hypothetical protein